MTQRTRCLDDLLAHHDSVIAVNAAKLVHADRRVQERGPRLYRQADGSLAHSAPEKQPYAVVSDGNNTHMHSLIHQLVLRVLVRGVDVTWHMCMLRQACSSFVSCWSPAGFCVVLQANRHKWHGLVQHCRQLPGVNQQLERAGASVTQVLTRTVQHWECCTLVPPITWQVQLLLRIIYSVILQPPAMRPWRCQQCGPGMQRHQLALLAVPSLGPGVWEPAQPLVHARSTPGYACAVAGKSARYHINVSYNQHATALAAAGAWLAGTSVRMTPAPPVERGASSMASAQQQTGFGGLDPVIWPIQPPSPGS